MKYQIHIAPLNKSIPVEEGQTLLEAFRKAEVFIKSSCGGCASCGECVVKVLEGKDHLLEQTFEEKRLLGNVFHITSERLSCQTKICGNIKVDIGGHDQRELEHERRRRETKKILLRKSKDVEKKEVSDPTPAKSNEKQGGFKRPKAFKYSEEE
ncbi:MAG: 2Fe-2S iron-sulfur cluster binding domain-containing protein [Halobacteriovoraceae bacterium]|nr:2Fe-2S iron-sulfur cluster binding domain-containing protein [Halobacteriovoraceae bacterium]